MRLNRNLKNVEEVQELYLRIIKLTALEAYKNYPVVIKNSDFVKHSGNFLIDEIAGQLAYKNNCMQTSVYKRVKTSLKRIIKMELRGEF